MLRVDELWETVLGLGAQNNRDRDYFGTIAHAAPSFRKWQAVTPGSPAGATRAGASTSQRTSARGQRGWNGQPDGLSIGLGGSPLSRTVVRLPCSRGAAARSALVYGCRGSSKTRSRGPYSTIRPRY